MADRGFADGIALLGRRNVGRLFVAYLVTFAGTAMAPIGLAFGVLEMTGSAADTGTVVMAQPLAGVAILLLGGAIADRTSRKRVIVSAESLAMVAQLSIATLLLTETATLPLLFLLMLLNGIAMAFNAPASAGLIVQLVPREELQPVNALLGIARNGAFAIGATLGGVLVATVGAGWTLAIDGASFGISALLIATLTPREQRTSEGSSILEELREGASEFFSHTWLWVIVAQFSLLVGVHESVMGLIGPAVSRASLGGATSWGWIAGALGAGTLAGGLLSMRISPRHPMRVATLLTFAFATLPAALAVPLPVPLIALTAFVNGGAGSIFAVLWYTTLQRKIPEEMLSRVSAYDHLGSIVLAPIGIWAAGHLSDDIGASRTLWIGVTTVLTASAVAFCVRDVRMMTNDV